MSVINPTTDEALRHFRHGRLMLHNLLKGIPDQSIADVSYIHRDADNLYDNLLRLLDGLEETGWSPLGRREGNLETQ